MLICTGIAVTRRYNVEAHVVVTMETSSAFISQEDFQTNCFLKDGLMKSDVSAG